MLSEVLRDAIGSILTPELAAEILLRYGKPELEVGVVSQAIPADPVVSDPRLVVDQHSRVASWVAAQIGCDEHAWAEYTTIGLEKAGVLVAGVVFESFTGTAVNIHVAGVGRYWCNRSLLFSVFDYAFRQLKLKRLTGLVPAHNQDALRFNLHLGFEIEALMKDACPEGDVYILRMTPDMCRFVEV